MKNKKALVDKFFAGNTNLHEEQMLKKHFSKHTSEPTDAGVSKMLTAYTTLAQEKVLSNNFDKALMAKIRVSNPKTRSYVWHWSSLSIAASLLFAVGIFTFSEKKEAYVIEQGVRYDDMEKAVGYADKAINEAIAPLKLSMQSLQPIKGLEGALIPVSKGALLIDNSK